MYLMPGFYLIARIAGDARIGPCVEIETVLFSLPAINALAAILAFEIENVLPHPCVKGKPTEHEFQRLKVFFQKVFLCYLLLPLWR